MRQCQDAGVRVMVITGDSKETAAAIARDVNIFGPDEVPICTVFGMPPVLILLLLVSMLCTGIVCLSRVAVLY